MSVMQSTGLEVDLYHLDAVYIAWKSGYTGDATFDLYTRKVPFAGGFMLTAGLEPAADHIQALSFTDHDLHWLETIKQYDPAFLQTLANTRFTGEVLAMPEGEIAFANEPMVRVTAPFIEAMLLESGLLREIGISTLMATKAGRIYLASQGRSFADFSFRRAHEPMWAARSAFIGGAESTSYVAAAQRYNIPSSGTIPHAIVQAYPDELTAFREIAALMPDYTLLLDTYDVDQGIDNAIQAANDEAASGSGHRLVAVRIDSGDLAEWARLVKSRLDAAGMSDVKILVSGDMDEYAIEALVASGAPIDGYGVGGNLGVGLGTIASGTVGGVIGAVYKLAYMDGGSDPGARMKIAGSKSTWPGRKAVYRVGDFEHDVIALEDEPAPTHGRSLLQPWMIGDSLVHPHPSLTELRERGVASLESLPERLKATTVTEPYDVRFSDGIQALRARIEAEHVRS